MSVSAIITSDHSAATSKSAEILAQLSLESELAACTVVSSAKIEVKIEQETNMLLLPKTIGNRKRDCA